MRSYDPLKCGLWSTEGQSCYGCSCPGSGAGNFSLHPQQQQSKEQDNNAHTSYQVEREMFIVYLFKDQGHPVQDRFHICMVCSDHNDQETFKPLAPLNALMVLKVEISWWLWHSSFPLWAPLSLLLHSDDVYSLASIS